MSIGDNYRWAYSYLPSELNSIVEVGSRDALDAIDMSERFKCQVAAFEADPAQFAVCARNVREAGANVLLRPEALSDSCGAITFWQVDKDLYGNAGVSSVFQLDFDNRNTADPDRGRPPVQRAIQVQAATWTSLDLPTPSLLAMDVQGSELQVLRGFGATLRSIDFIITEVEPVSSYVGGCTFSDVHSYLTSRGFQFAASDVSGQAWATLKWGLRLRHIKAGLVARGGFSRYQGMFNVLYRNGDTTTSNADRFEIASQN